MGTTNDAIREIIANVWVKCMKEVLDSMVPGAFQVQQAGAEKFAKTRDSSDWTWRSQALDRPGAPRILLGASGETWNALGSAVLKGLGVEQEDPQDILSTSTDLVAQCNSSFAGELSSKLKSQMNFGAVENTEPFWDAPAAFITITGGGLPMEAQFAIGLDAAFRAMITARDERGRRQLPGPIADLRVNLYALLGATEMQLGNVIKLSVGTVIDIRQSVNDLVRVVANGKVVAAGKVVSYKGNYAIKVVCDDSGDAQPFDLQAIGKL